MRNTRGGTIVVGDVNSDELRLLLEYAVIVFVLNTLNASNISFTRFLPPRKLNTFCALRSSSSVDLKRVVPLSSKDSVP